MDLSISQMLSMQQELFKIHEDTWSPMEPEYGKDFFLYMVEELGEAIAILKKKRMLCCNGGQGGTGCFSYRNGGCSDVL